MSWSIGTLALSLCLQTAEEWMNRFETSVREARTLEIVVTGEVSLDPDEEPPEIVPLHTRLVIGTNGRLRMEFTRTVMGREYRLETRCDGTAIAFAADGRWETETPPVMASGPMAEGFRILEARLGAGTVWDLQLASVADDPSLFVDENPQGLLRVENLALAGEENIGERRTVKLTYTLQTLSPAEDEGQEFAIQLWLDADTALPVRRVVSQLGGHGIREMTLTYTRFELNPDLADTEFEIPAEWR